MKVLQIFLDLIGWFQIVIGTTFGSAIIAVLIYYFWPNQTIKIVAIIILSLGFLFGVIWATRIWIKYGTVNWLSQIRRIS